MLRCFHYSVGTVHDLRRNRALVVYQYCKCHKRWLAFAENFWKNLQEIPGKNLDHYYIPKLIIQPLIENAVIHGTSKISDKGIIAILGSTNGTNLQICVKDNGP